MGLLHSANLHRAASSNEKRRRWATATSRFLYSVPAVTWPPTPTSAAAKSGTETGGHSHQQRVRARIAQWRRIGAPKRVLRWIREGVRLAWLDGPPPPFHHGVSRVPEEDRAWAKAEVARCLQTGAFVPATCFDHVSRAFIVTHNGKRRLVLNFKEINSSLAVCPKW